MKLPTLREIGTEAKLLLIGIPVFIWTMVPIYHMFLFAISPKEDAFSGKLWPAHPTLNNFKHRVPPGALLPARFLDPVLQFGGDRAFGRRADLDDRDRGRVLDLAAARARRPLGDESGAAHLFHSGGVPRRADVPHHGQLRPVEQSLVADPRHGDDRFALRDLGAEAGLRQAAGRTRRSRHHGRRHHAATVPPGLCAA